MKAAYNIPMCVNNWLAGEDTTPGDYLSGGPQPRVVDIWKAAGNAIDIYTPDIYQANFAEWCRTGNLLAYARGSFDSNIWRIPGPNALDKNSPPTRFMASTQSDLEPQFSPDGKKIAFSSARSGDEAIWLCDRDGLNPVELRRGKNRCVKHS